MLTSNMINEESPKVQELIQKHEKVFQELLMKLPPKREIKSNQDQIPSTSNRIDIHIIKKLKLRD